MKKKEKERKKNLDAVSPLNDWISLSKWKVFSNTRLFNYTIQHQQIVGLSTQIMQ